MPPRGVGHEGDIYEFLIAKQDSELADNKLSKDHGHDIASRIIDSAQAGLRKACLLNIAEKNDYAAVLQVYKTSRDQGETLDLENLHCEPAVVSRMP